MTTIAEKVDRLERVDYDRYLTQVRKLSENDVLAIMADWRLYRRAFVWVVEKMDDGRPRPVRFDPRPWQQDYETSRTNFDIALKSRKVGFTTDVLTEAYAKAATLPYQKAMFMSYEERASRETADILQTAHNMNPFKPPLFKNNSETMVFQDTKSSIAVATAGAKVLARGLDLTMLHMSEVSHYYKTVDDVSNFMAGVLDAVARGGRIVQESTPNGEDPIFFATWQHAKSGELWHPLFLSVFKDQTVDWNAEHPEVLPSTRNEEFDLSDYERSLMDMQGASRGHIRFLRYEKQKINARSPLQPTSDMIIGDERMLLQEYPTDDISCFLSSQENVFDPEITHLYRMRAKPPMWIEQSGALRIWERPQNGRPYVIGVDTSEGLPQSDWQAISVLDVDRLKFVAHLRIKTNWAELGRLVFELGRQYNEALVSVERNSGGTTLLYILTEQLAYPNMYYQEETTIFGGGGRLGWYTDSRTKPWMVDVFREMYEAGALDINDEDALREIGSFRNYPTAGRGKDKYRAPSGGTDDLLMSMMIAVMCRDNAYITQQTKPIHYGSF